MALTIEKMDFRKTKLIYIILFLLVFMNKLTTIYGKALVTGLFSTAIMSVSVLMLMQLRLPNTVGLFIEVACGAIVYAAVNMAMKNALIFEIIEKIKSKILCKN